MVVPNGVDEELFELAEPAGGQTVLFFGDFDYEPNARGVARFLSEAWPLVAKRRDDARLRLVGRGAAERLGELAARTPGAEAVGFVPSVAAELAAARLVVVPVWQGGGTRIKVAGGGGRRPAGGGEDAGVAGPGFVPCATGGGRARAGACARARARRSARARAPRFCAARCARSPWPRRWRERAPPLARLYRQWLGFAGPKA